MKSWSKKKKILLAITCFMILVVLFAVGKPISHPWPLSLQLQMPNLIDVNDDHLATIDRQFSRLTIASNKGKVETVKEINKKDTGESYNLIKLTNNEYYYSIVTRFSNSSYIQKEQIFCCNYSINPYENPNLVFEKTYDESEKNFNPSFFHLAETEWDNDVGVLVKNTDNNSIDLISIKNNSGSTLHSWDVSMIKGGLWSASCSSRSGELAVLTSTGELYHSKIFGEFSKISLSKFYFFSDCSWSNTGYIFCIDSKDNSLVCLDPNRESVISTVENPAYYCVHSAGLDNYIVCGTENGIDVFDSNAYYAGMTSSPEPLLSFHGSLDYSIFLSFLTILVWIAITYLSLLVIISVIKLIKKIIRLGKSEKLVRSTIVVVGLLAIVGLSIFTLHNSTFLLSKTDYRL